MVNKLCPLYEAITMFSSAEDRQSFAQLKEIKRCMKRVTVRVEVWQVGTNVSLKHNSYIYMINQKYYLNHNMSMV